MECNEELSNDNIMGIGKMSLPENEPMRARNPEGRGVSRDFTVTTLSKCRKNNKQNSQKKKKNKQKTKTGALGKHRLICVSQTSFILIVRRPCLKNSVMFFIFPVAHIR